MGWLIFIAVSVAIPEGWPMLRGNQQRTGYVAGVSCFTDTCQVKWELLVENSEMAIIFNGPVSADFNTDSKNDIVIGICAGGFPVSIVYRGYDGAVLWRADSSGGGPKYGSPCLMDINSDMRPEVFLSSDNYYGGTPLFLCLNGANGNGVWNQDMVAFPWYSAPLAIDGTPPTIVVGGGDGVLRALNATTGNIIWTYNVSNDIQPASLGDVDVDGNPEIVVVGGKSIYVLSMAGVLEWR